MQLQQTCFSVSSSHSFKTGAHSVFLEETNATPVVPQAINVVCNETGIKQLPQEEKVSFLKAHKFLLVKLLLASSVVIFMVSAAEVTNRIQVNMLVYKSKSIDKI